MPDEVRVRVKMLLASDQYRIREQASRLALPFGYSISHMMSTTDFTEMDHFRERILGSELKGENQGRHWK